MYVSEEDNDQMKELANEEDSVMCDSGNESKTTICNIRSNIVHLSDEDIRISRAKEYQLSKVVDRFADISNTSSFGLRVPLSKQDILSDRSSSVLVSAADEDETINALDYDDLQDDDDISANVSTEV